MTTHRLDLPVLAAIAVGGLLGGAARVAAEGAAEAGGAPAWVALVAVNVLGSFVLGLVASRGGRWAGPAVTTGLLGGFTSFSGWIVDILQLVGPAPVLALALLVAVPVATVAACLVGLVAGGGRP